MKKLVLSISFLCYLAVTSGIIVNYHYCMDRLSSTQLFATQNTTCPKCGMHIKKSHGCCRDEVKLVKMEVDQKVTSPVSFELPSLDALVCELSPFIVTSLIDAGGKSEWLNHSPPLLSDQDTYLVNRVFRI